MDERLKQLEAIARRYYKKDGQNQWPHIQRVVQQAELLAKYRGKALDETELAALYFHDVDKNKSGEMDHGAYAALRMKEILKGKIAERRLQIAANAVADHNLDKPSRSAVGDLLRSADANKPDLDWFLRKSYNKMTGKGLTHDQALANALDKAQEHVHTAGHLNNPPKMYTELFAKEIAKANREADRLKLEEVWGRIQRYNEQHPDESVYT